MRYLLNILTIFMALPLAAQSPMVNSNIEPSRPVVVGYSTADEAVKGSVDASSKYFRTITKWSEGEEPGVLKASLGYPFAWLGRQVYLRVGEASAPYSLLVNGREVGSSQWGVVPAEFDITKFVKEGANSLEIRLKESDVLNSIEAWAELSAQPTVSGVYVHSQPTMMLRDVDVVATRTESGLSAEIAMVVKSAALNDRVSTLRYELYDPLGRRVGQYTSDLTLSMRGEDTLRYSVNIPDSMSWSVEKPNIYRLSVATVYHSRVGENLSFDLGFRSVEMGHNGEILINGRAQKLKIYDVDSKIDINSLDELKSQGYNALRIAAGLYQPELYSVADRVGMLVLPTAPINTSKGGDDILRWGNPSNNPVWVDTFGERVDAIYDLTKLHPSVIGFVIAESSLNGISLYESYLRLKAREQYRPIIYFDGGGEWNSDALKVE